MGTGLLKPNVSSMVGSLYRKEDTRRDAGFSLFYTGINLGAFFAPFVTGWLGQKINWHIGFAAAGVGMVLGVITYVSGKKYLTPVEPEERAAEVHKSGEVAEPGLTPAEQTRMYVLAILWCFCVVFWAGYEQAGTSLNLFADRATSLTLFGFNYPSSWFQSIAPLCVWVFAGIFAVLWTWLGKIGREPSSPVKFTMGLMFLSLSYLLIVQGARIHEQQHILVSGLWLGGVYLLQTFGEICLYPTGMSMVTKLSPPRLVGRMMGFWFLSIAIGNWIAGQVAGMLKDRPFSSVFWIAFVISGVAALLLALLIPTINRMLRSAK
jgi:POT family proton-dependent oligopeptide transporter